LFFLGPCPGYLPFSHRFEASAAAKTTPVLHCHGSIDPVVRLPWAEAGVKRLKEAKSRVSGWVMLVVGRAKVG